MAIARATKITGQAYHTNLISVTLVSGKYSAIERAQAWVKSFVPVDRSLAQELMVDRHRES